MWWCSLRRRYYRRQTSAASMRQFLSAKLPARRCAASDVPFLVVDLETTSLDPQQGEIASLGWVPIDNGKVVLAGAGHHYVSVQQGVGQSAAFHQINDTELAGSDSIRPNLERFLHAAQGRVLVFHNASLDMGFLNAVCRRLFDVPMVAPVADTLLLEKIKVLRTNEGVEPGALRLFACRERYGLPDYPAHNALTDAIATAELLLAQLAYRGSDTLLADII